MAIVHSFTCSHCKKSFCVVGRHAFDPGSCRPCRELAEIDTRWGGIDELIAFYETPETLARVKSYRASTSGERVRS